MENYIHQILLFVFRTLNSVCISFDQLLSICKTIVTNMIKLLLDTLQSFEKYEEIVGNQKYPLID